MSSVGINCGSLTSVTLVPSGCIFTRAGNHRPHEYSVGISTHLDFFHAIKRELPRVQRHEFGSTPIRHYEIDPVYLGCSG